MASVSARPTTQSALLALAVATLCASGAQAKDMPGGFIHPGEATAAPRGFVEMCESGAAPEFCSPTQPLVAGAALVTAGLSEQAARRDADGPSLGSGIAPRIAAAAMTFSPADCPGPPIDPRLRLTGQQTVPPLPHVDAIPAIGCGADGGGHIDVATPWQPFAPPGLVGTIAWQQERGPSLASQRAPVIAQVADASLWTRPAPCAPSAIASMLMAVSTQLCAYALPAAPRPEPAIPKADATPAALPEEALRTLLKQVNRHVNGRVRQRTDEEIYGVGELWRRSGDGKDAVGDCEDLAIEKRAELIAAGFPPDRLAFAVVYSRASGLHTVLVARTAAEDVVLDGRSPYVTSWSKVPYSWISVQSMNDPMLWYALDTARAA